MLQGMVLLLLFQFVGEGLSRLLGLPIPGNVIGMALMLLALVQGWVKVKWLEQAADLLLSYMALFFVPAGVGVMLYFDLIAREWLPIVAGTVISTFVVLAVTGWCEKLLDKQEESQS
ncbi:holin-like protein [Malonomonas rubra DSM 5091]|uniref:Holin-like protein n=1 Tax=Malonomonas rubra DSM 5091 TaxID=1122189 RepID=A0A1M6BJP7_MALRU|nr:CidA/LrgA family protein [Malonomonas rubra]SHI48713.1 holin-like protein [Malonomonas rubra DSM 5091]